MKKIHQLLRTAKHSIKKPPAIAGLIGIEAIEVTYRVFLTALIVVDNINGPQNLKSLLLLANAQKEPGALISEYKTDCAEQARQTVQEVQKTPGVELDAQARHVV